MKHFLYIFVFLLIFSSCVTEAETYDRIYIVENISQYNIKVKSFSIEEERNVVFDLISRGQIKRNYTGFHKPIRIPANDEPFSFFVSNKVEIVFNNQKKSVYCYNGDFFEPIDRNPLRHGSYKQLNKTTYKYTITEQDYENATPCNGDCE